MLKNALYTLLVVKSAEQPDKLTTLKVTSKPLLPRTVPINTPKLSRLAHIVDKVVVIFWVLAETALFSLFQF